MTENQISYKIRSAIFNVYNVLGPGLLESAYEATLSYELKKAGLDVVTQIPLPLIYESIKLNAGYRVDMIVNNIVLLEIKSVDQLSSVHHKQVITYLKLSGLKLGLLVNFNTDDLSSNIFRKVNGL